jgi:hypothetical protein
VTGRGTNDAAQIGSSANTSKNYVIAGGSFVATDSTANAIVAPSADGQDDPIYNVAAVGDIINLTPTQ